MKQKKIFICLTIALLFAACEKESPNDLLSEAKTLITEQKYSEALGRSRSTPKLLKIIPILVLLSTRSS